MDGMGLLVIKKYVPEIVLIMEIVLMDYVNV
jgi:hypothetical protein